MKRAKQQVVVSTWATRSSCAAIRESRLPDDSLSGLQDQKASSAETKDEKETRNPKASVQLPTGGQVVNEFLLSASAARSDKELGWAVGDGKTQCQLFGWRKARKTLGWRVVKMRRRNMPLAAELRQLPVCRISWTGSQCNGCQGYGTRMGQEWDKTYPHKVAGAVSKGPADEEKGGRQARPR